MAVRIQRQRKKGWRMPEGTVYVGRPTQWGNEFPHEQYGRKLAVEMYVVHLASYFGFVQNELSKAFHPFKVESTVFTDWIKPLRGKDLACWCPVDEPCHADVLLELARDA